MFSGVLRYYEKHKQQYPRGQTVKRNSKGFGIVEIILVVAVVALAGTVGYLAYQNLSKQPSTSTTTSQTTTQTSTSTASDLTKEKAVQLYNEAKATSNLTVSDVGDLTQKDSATVDYKTAELSVPDAMALFYRTPDGVWHFFKGTQQKLQCSMYSTSDLKKAYVGDSCYDASGADAVVSAN